MSLWRICLLTALLVAPGFALPQRDAVTAKRSHLATVVAELSKRDVSRLDVLQRARRAKVLSTLTRYANRGRFPINAKLPQFELPYLIDHKGTRCALAFAIDDSGHELLLHRLAARNNHAWIADLIEHAELRAWLRDHGLTLEEAAFIQAPSIIDDPSDLPDNPPADPPTTPPDNGVPQPTPAPTPEPPSNSSTTRTRGRATTDFGDWNHWWRANRDAFVNLRARYHAAAATTGRDGTSGRARRPTADELARLDATLATSSKRGRKTRASALMAWTMASKQRRVAPAVAGTHDYLRAPESRYRDVMLLSLGIAGDPTATTTLRSILRDTKDGRRALQRKSRIAASTRAFAAMALGAARDPGAVGDLLAVSGERRARADVRAACITALGLCLERATPEVRAEAVETLTTAMKRGRWNDRVLASIPMALVRSNDVEAHAAVLRVVSRFRGEARLRASCALALGHSKRGLEEDVVLALVAASRRDPDVQVRRHATIALGELALADKAATWDSAMARRVYRHLIGTLDGHFKAGRAIEFHLLASGLFARRFGAEAAKLVRRIEKVAMRGGARDKRAAATLALGLSGHENAHKPLLALLGKARDVTLRGAAAESLGLLGTTAARPALQTIVRNERADSLRYQAALGLGYLADGAMVPELVTELARTGSVATRAALTRVLGQIGDRRSLAGLTKLAVSDKSPRAVRERALGALGLIARDSDDSWTLPFRRGCNYEAATPTVRVLLSIF